MAALDIVTLVVLFALNIQTSASGPEYYTARCDIREDSGIPDQKIHGTLHLSQHRDGGNVTIKVSLGGFVNADGLHGFHVHEFGDTGNQCMNAGGHYNPFNATHGGPLDKVRHVGDLGNVEVIGGRVDETHIDHVISLRYEDGLRRIIGKTMDVHLNRDTLTGRSGHAGPRLGCCIVVYTTRNEAPGD